MRIDRKNDNEERRVLIGMITDGGVLARLSGRWETGGLFRGTWCNLIASWCLKYYERYGEPPNREIEGRYERWIASGRSDAASAEAIGDFLADLSEEWAEWESGGNTQYVLDTAANVFNRVKLARVADAVQDFLVEGDGDKAEEVIAAHRRVELGDNAAIDVFQDREALRAAFQAKAEPVIKYHGALGDFFGEALERDGFVSIIAPTGRGKSFWLLDMGFRAALARKRVAFVSIGDMTQPQVMRRIASRASRRPWKPETLDMPIGIVRNKGDRNAELQTKQKSFDAMTIPDAEAAMERIVKTKIRSRNTMFRLRCFPSDGITAAEIEALMEDWTAEGWEPDVIIVDYADLIRRPQGYSTDPREGINATWKHLRGMSQRRHCLVLTATQADADSFNRWIVTRHNFSEDRRKMDHVTAMFALNQTEDEKGRGVMRLNWIKLRDAEYLESRCVYVAGSLAVANPAIISTF